MRWVSTDRPRLPRWSSRSTSLRPSEIVAGDVSPPRRWPGILPRLARARRCGCRRMIALQSIRPRQAEHMLCQKAQDQIRGDRRHLIEPRFAELAFDVVFLGKAEASVGLNTGFRRRPGGV